MSVEDRIIAQFKRGPATCADISRATGLPLLRVSTSMNHLHHRLEVKKAGEVRINRHYNRVQVWALCTHRATLLDECWTRPATLEWREGV